MEIHQFSCREVNGIDLRQANALLKHKPDMVFWEAPSNKNSASLILDPRQSIVQQKDTLRERISYLKEVAKKVPWAASDIHVYENAIKLIENGYKIRMYHVDGPHELLLQTILNKWDLIEKPRQKGRHILWWTYIYLRERIMANNIKPLLKNKDQKILIFMQKFHWLHVNFLLSEPSKDMIWGYYFGKFENVTRKNISEILKTRNKVLHKFWLKYSDFV
jgi:hypothetical protein